jgi:hypothetical protein
MLRTYVTVSAPMRRAATISTLSNQMFGSSCSLPASARSFATRAGPAL